MEPIKNSEVLNQHIEALIKIEPQFSFAYQRTGAIELRTSEGGYASLVRTIIGQQVSVASAQALWSKLNSANLTSLHSIHTCDEAALKACGLSRQKTTYLKHLAASGIDFNEIQNLANDEVIKQLTAVKGIGLWSAEIYLMFALKRQDVFAAGDLALQEAVRILFKLDERPNERELRKLANEWSPYRNAAAQLLWAFYHVVKDRAGV